jgi:DamX protein
MTTPENDEVIYHPSHSDKRQSLDNIHRLVTLERSQKLDLLIHLINNLSQPLVVCGPEGIGKTTLLNVLQSHKQDHWRLFWTEASPQQSFERLTEQCRQALADLDGDSLTEKLSQLDQRQQKLVWIIDNAGELVPGLISALIQLAKPFDCLRLIFALTHDELHLKNSSDPEISECHLIEIPPLNQQHYTAFLQNLSAGQGAMISFKAINDGLVENLYRKTHGIPGKIIEELPRLSHYKTLSPVALGSTLAIIAGLAVAGALLYLNKPESQSKTAFETDITDTLYKKQPVDVAVSTPVIQHEPAAVNLQRASTVTTRPALPETLADNSGIEHAESLSEPDFVEKTEPQVLTDKITPPEPQEAPVQQPIADETAASPEIAAGDTVDAANTDEPENTLPVQQAKTPPLPPEPVKAMTTAPASEPNDDLAPAVAVSPVKTESAAPLKKAVAEKSIKTVKPEGLAWLESRNPKHFTLQIMVLSQLSGVKKLMQKYPVLQQKARYFPVQRQGKTHYVIVLGDYPSHAAAKNARKTLPKALAKAWVRSFKILQQQTRS